MEDSVEKSCWGITAWTVGIVVGAFAVVSLIANPLEVEPRDGAIAPVSQQANATDDVVVQR